MAELIARPVFAGQEAFSWGGITLSALQDPPTWGIALYPEGAAEAERLLAAQALHFPAPGEIVAPEGGARLAWWGRAQALLFGAAPPEGLARAAAITDLSGAYGGMLLSGSGSDQVLARLVPLDLRPRSFAEGRAARSLLREIPLYLIRTGPDSFELRVPRSMAQTAWAELREAMVHLEARRSG